MTRDNPHTIPALSDTDLRSIPPDGGTDYNRLIFEKSPYLLQHATNPIDWYPWNESALEQARRKDKPIFLSIGYSTCHWCHVMANESFSDRQIAEQLNSNYVSIKVDREERPDIDNTYMQACQAMTGSGGWPLTLVLTPDLHPFFAATYIPRDNRHGMMGLNSLLEKICTLWKTDRQRIDSSGKQILELLRRSIHPRRAEKRLSPGLPSQAARELVQQFDPIYGGFGSAPKFPTPHNLSLLLRVGQIRNDRAMSDMALQTLQQIRYGGIYDQLAGGIHRYSVDERWLVPHFEKMLYDQALLILACCDAYQASGDHFYLEVGLDTAAYVIERLRDKQGGFYCGEDADSEGTEGACYLWDLDELEDRLEQHELAAIKELFGISASGNFEGRNILWLPHGLDQKTVDLARNRLLPIRDRRVQPHRDDKILTAWNGLAIAALARLGMLGGNKELIEAAAAAASFIDENLFREDGRLLRRWRQGQAAVPAFLEDYAALAWGFLELYQASLDAKDLALALQLTDDMSALFSDGNGGFYDSAADSDAPLLRGRNLQDGALPCGNSLAALVLIRLGRLCGRVELLDKGSALLDANDGILGRYPAALTLSALAYCDIIETRSLVITSRDKESAAPLIDAARETARLGTTLLLALDADPMIGKLAPITAGKSAQKNQATAWLCGARHCYEPTGDPQQLSQLLAISSS